MLDIAIIPTAVLRADRRKLTIPATFATRLASYRERWETIAEVAA